MEVRFADTFWPSFKRLIQSENPWHWRYYKSKWYDFKWQCWATRKYRKIVKEMIPWDYGSILKMLEFQLSVLSHHLEHKGFEVEESRMKKVKDMKRAIKLLQHQNEDDFIERCGYQDTKFKFIDLEDGTRKMEHEDEEVARHNKRVFKQANELEQKEWNELFELLKQMRSWWD